VIAFYSRGTPEATVRTMLCYYRYEMRSDEIRKNEEEISTTCSGLLVCVYLEDITLCRAIMMFLYSLKEQDTVASFYMFIPTTQSIFARQD